MEVEQDTAGQSQFSQKPRRNLYCLMRVLSEEKENARCGHGFLIIAVHAGMMELGFVGFDVHTSEACLGFQLPKGWATKREVSICYSRPQIAVDNGDDKAAKDVELQFQLMGDSLVVRRSINDFPYYCNLSLKVRNFFPAIQYLCLINSIEESSCFMEFLNNVVKIGEIVFKIGEGQDSLGRERDVFEMWRFVKDGLTFLCEKAGLSLGSSLMMLPVDLQMKILKGLRGVDLVKVGCVCTELRILVSDDNLWQQNCMDGFHYLTNNGELLYPFWIEERHAHSWKDAYKRMWMHRKTIDTMLNSYPNIYNTPIDDPSHCSHSCLDSPGKGFIRK